MQAPYDLRDYVLGELTTAEREQVELWLQTAPPAARAEVERLELTLRALQSAPEEIPPRRLAFVSDKVFEPSRGVRLWRWLAGAGPRFAFGLAAALAVVFAGVWATEPTLRADEQGWTLSFGVEPAPTPVVDELEIGARIEAAVAASEERQRRVAERLAAAQVAEAEQRWQAEIHATRVDIEAGWRLMTERQDRLMRDLATLDLAEAR